MADVAGSTHHVVLNGQGYMLRRAPWSRASVAESPLRWSRGEAPYLVGRTGTALNRDVLSRPETVSGTFAAGFGGDWGSGAYARGQGIDARAGGLRAAALVSPVAGTPLAWSAGWDMPGWDTLLGGAFGVASKVWRYKRSDDSLVEHGGVAAAQTTMPVFEANGYVWFVQYTGAGAPIVAAGAAATGGPAIGAVAGAADGVNAYLVEAPGVNQSIWFAQLRGLTAATVWTASGGGTGDTSSALWGMFGYGGKVYVARENGVFALRRESLAAGQPAQFDLALEMRGSSWSRSAAWVPMFCEFGGAVYYIWGERLWKWSGGTGATEVSPPALVVGPTGEEMVTLTVRSMSAGRGWLWCLAESDEASPGVYLLAYNPTGGAGAGGPRWEMIGQIAAGSGSLAVGVHYSGKASPARVLMSCTPDGGTWQTWRMDVSAAGIGPATPTAASGNYCYLPALDGGLPGEMKLWRYVSVRASGAWSGREVGVAYWNGSTWVSLGLTAGGEGGVLTLPTTYVSRRLLLRLELKTDGVKSAVVREVAAGYVLLPDPIPQTEFEVLLGPMVRKLDGTTETKTPRQLLTTLYNARASGQVVQLADPYTSAQGLASRPVRVQEVEVRAMRVVPNASGHYGWYARVTCLDV